LFHTREGATAAAALAAGEAAGERGGGGLRILRNLGGGSEGGEAEKVSRVTVRLDGISHDFDLPYDGSSLLDAALMEGVDLPFACKGGVCCTCRAKLMEGQVEMEVNYALEADELAAGFILTCQSHPRTDRVIVDYDSK
jgi:ring-1,2-phenylacetyl-CoA epoxidase subunit PaaE